MLTKQQLFDIEKLQKEVEAFDKLELKLNWGMLRAREDDQNDFLYYKENELIAFIGLYAFGSTVEMTGMVKPLERHKDYFTQLFTEAMRVVREKGYKNILLNAPASSQSAKRFLKKQGASYAFTEHQMKWKARTLEVATGFVLRQATLSDLDRRVQLNVESFDILREDAVEMESRINGEEDTDVFMIEVHNESVGKIRVTREKTEAWIYGFSILPKYQKKGIGHKVLQSVVRQESEKGYSVHLDVETKNDRALGLYESVGFEAVHEQDYYEYKQDETMQ